MTGNILQILLRSCDLLHHGLEIAAQFTDIIRLIVVDIDIKMPLSHQLGSTDNLLQAQRQTVDHIERQQGDQQADKNQPYCHLSHG